MNVNRAKKRALTLMEMMIVILLITLVTGVVGYNMKGALDRGKAFRSQTAQDQLRDLLILRSSEGTRSLEQLVSLDTETLKRELENTGLTKDPEALLKDGWGGFFDLKLSRDKKDVMVSSKRLNEYNKKHSKPVEIEREDEE